MFMNLCLYHGLQYVISINLNYDNALNIIDILEKCKSNVELKSNTDMIYIEIKCLHCVDKKYFEFENMKCIKLKNKFDYSLNKINSCEIPELLNLSNDDKYTLNNFLMSDLNNYIIDHGWYYSCNSIALWDEKCRRLYYDIFLEYNIVIDVDNNVENIKVFKNTIKKISENCDLYACINLFKQKDNGMKFIRLTKITGQRLTDSYYYKKMNNVWTVLSKFGRYKIDKSIDTDNLTEKEKKMLGCILNSEIKDNIISHGWYHSIEHILIEYT